MHSVPVEANNTRRTRLALIVGLTIALCGFACTSATVILGIWRSAVPNNEDTEGYVTGWYTDQSGVPREYRYDFSGSDLYSAPPALRSARLDAFAAGRAWQYTSYAICEAGRPVACVSYFRNMYGVHGLSENVPMADLRAFHAVIIKRIRGVALAVDGLLWGGAAATLVTIGIIARRRVRVWTRTRAGRCEHCGYLLTGLNSDVCPECGHAFRERTARE